MRRKTKWDAAALGLTTAGVFVLSATSASSLGYTDLPISRQKLCANGTVTGCGDIQREPHTVEGPKAVPAAGRPDGALCSGGTSRFSQVDGARAPSGGAWPTTKV